MGIAARPADRRFELVYRDALVLGAAARLAPAFRWPSAPAVDLRAAFVMPRARVEPGPGAASADVLDLVARHRRLAIVGPAGSGKSTFLAWLRLVVAAVDVALVAAGQQAVPMLVVGDGATGRPARLARPGDGTARLAAAVARATADRRVPPGWVERQLEAGRALVLVDGLNGDALGLGPSAGSGWLADLVARYPSCRCVVAARPDAIDSDALAGAGFVAARLDDLDDGRIHAAAIRWSTAARLARGEPDAAAGRAGRREGDAIYDACAADAGILDLARRPLFLSAICLVHALGGEIPHGQVALVRRCVEGLLHASAPGGAAPAMTGDPCGDADGDAGPHRTAADGAGAGDAGAVLRACAAVALAMRIAGRPDLPAAAARRAARAAAAAPGDGQALVDRARRAGLMIDRQPGCVAFTHDALVDHLAAEAVVRGLRRGWSVAMLLDAATDARWRGVVPLCCGLSEAVEARAIVEALLGIPGDRHLGAVIAAAWAAAPAGVRGDEGLCLRVADRVARLPGEATLESLPAEVVAPVAHACVGGTGTAAFAWLRAHPEAVDAAALAARLGRGAPADRSGIVFLVLLFGADDLLARVARDPSAWAGPADARLARDALGQRAAMGWPPGPGRAAAEAATHRALGAEAPGGPPAGRAAGTGTEPEVPAP